MVLSKWMPYLSFPQTFATVGILYIHHESNVNFSMQPLMLTYVLYSELYKYLVTRNLYIFLSVLIKTAYSKEFETA